MHLQPRHEKSSCFPSGTNEISLWKIFCSISNFFFPSFTRTLLTFHLCKKEGGRTNRAEKKTVKNFHAKLFVLLEIHVRFARWMLQNSWAWRMFLLIWIPHNMLHGRNLSWKYLWLLLSAQLENFFVRSCSTLHPPFQLLLLNVQYFPIEIDKEISRSQFKLWFVWFLWGWFQFRKRWR